MFNNGKNIVKVFHCRRTRFFLDTHRGLEVIEFTQICYKKYKN